MAQTKYTADFPRQARDFASAGRTDQMIAERLGISRQTYYEYRKQYPEFDDAIREGRNWVLGLAEVTLADLAFGRAQAKTTIMTDDDREIIRIKVMPPNLKALLILLKKIAPEEWDLSAKTSPKTPSTKTKDPDDVAFGSPEANALCHKMAADAARDLYKDFPREEIPEDMRELMDANPMSPVDLTKFCQPPASNPLPSAAPATPLPEAARSQSGDKSAGRRKTKSPRSSRLHFKRGKWNAGENLEPRDSEPTRNEVCPANCPVHQTDPTVFCQPLSSTGVRNVKVATSAMLPSRVRDFVKSHTSRLLTVVNVVLNRCQKCQGTPIRYFARTTKHSAFHDATHLLQHLPRRFSFFTLFRPSTTIHGARAA